MRKWRLREVRAETRVSKQQSSESVSICLIPKLGSCVLGLAWCGPTAASGAWDLVFRAFLPILPAALHSGPLEWLDWGLSLWELEEVRGEAWRGNGQGSRAKQTWVLVLPLFL